MSGKENRKVKKSTLKKIMPYIGRYKLYVVMSLIFAAVTVAITLYIPRLQVMPLI